MSAPTLVARNGNEAASRAPPPPRYARSPSPAVAGAERLNIQHPPIRIQHRFLHHLRQCRMREHGVHQLFFGGLQIHRHHVTLNELGDFGADHVGAEQLAGLLVEDHLDQALVLAERDRLAVADEGEAADADLDLLLLSRLLGEADGGDLRRAIGAAGNEPLVDRMRMQSLDRLDADDAFVLGLVRQERRAGDVADGIDAGRAGLADAVNDDGAALGFYAEFFQAEILDIADDADRGDDAIDGERLRAALAVIDGRGDAV